MANAQTLPLLLKQLGLPTMLRPSDLDNEL